MSLCRPRLGDLGTDDGPSDLESYCDDGMVGTYAGNYKKGNGKGDKVTRACLDHSALYKLTRNPVLRSKSIRIPIFLLNLCRSLSGQSYGGYANYHRAPSHFVFKIPDGLDPALAAPMLCGGVTVFCMSFLFLFRSHNVCARESAS